MTWWAVGAAVVSAGVGYAASDKASGAITKGNKGAIAEQRRQFDTIMGLQQPYAVTGTGAINKLARLMGLPYSPYQAPGSAAASGMQGAVSRTVGSKSSDIVADLGFGAFGSNSSRKATWGPGTGQTFTTQQVRKMLKQGMSIEEITKLGRLETSLNAHRLRKLNKKGIDTDEILRLQQQDPTSLAARDPANSIVTPEGPDLSEFTESPDYRFRQTEGLNAVDRTAAARGGALSGNAIRGAEEFASNLASTEYGNFFNRLAAIAGIGQTAANTASSAASATGGNISSLLASSGQARASGIMGGANSVAGALNSGLNNWLLLRGGYFDRPAAGG